MLALQLQCLRSHLLIIVTKGITASVSPRQRRQSVMEGQDALKETIVSQVQLSSYHVHQDSLVLMMACPLLTQRLSYVRKGITV